MSDADRKPGWYWVRVHPGDKPEPKQWCVSGDIKFWNRRVDEPPLIIAEVICRIEEPSGG